MAYAGLMWLPLIALAAIGAWRYMDSLTQAKADKSSYVKSLGYGQTWIMSFLYIGTFGSFIGFSFALPLVIKNTFPEFLAGHPFIATYLAGLGLRRRPHRLGLPAAGRLAVRQGRRRQGHARGFLGMAVFTGTAIVGVSSSAASRCSSAPTW